MSAIDRQHQIRDAVRGFTTPTPSADVEDAFWHVERGSPGYHRLVDTAVADDEDIHPVYDVYLDAEVTRTRFGELRVDVDVVWFDPQAWLELTRTEIVHKVFDGYQPPEQAFLLNAHHCQGQIRDAMEGYFETAERQLEADRK